MYSFVDVEDDRSSRFDAHAIGRVESPPLRKKNFADRVTIARVVTKILRSAGRLVRISGLIIRLDPPAAVGDHAVAIRMRN